MTSTSPGPVAERVVLGALIDGDNVDYLQDAMSILAPGAFGHPASQKVFTAISDLFLDGTPVGLEAVREHMARKGTIDAIGGYPGLTDLTHTVLSEPQSAPRQYLAQLADQYAATVAAQELHQIASELGSKLSIDGARERTEDLFTRPSHTSAALPRLHEQVTAVAEELQFQIANPNAQRGILTGWAEFDGTADRRPLIGGLRAPWLVYIAARPAVGKTVVLCDWLRSACKQGHGTYCASSEMGESEIIMRLAVAESKTVRLDDAIHRPHTLSADKLEQLNNAFARISEWPLIIDDSAVDVPTIASRAAAARAGFRAAGADLDVVFQDYVQLLQDPAGTASSSDYARITANSTRLKLLAKRLTVPVAAAVQIGRDAAAGDRPPRPDDLKGSGQLEQDADAIIGLHRPYATNPSEENPHLPEDMTAFILKYRHGTAGPSCKRMFLGAFARTIEPTQSAAAAEAIARRDAELAQEPPDVEPPPVDYDHHPRLEGMPPPATSAWGE